MADAHLLEAQPTSLLVSLRVRREDGDQCAETLSQLHGRLMAFDGFDSLDVVRREAELGTDFHIIARFRDEGALERWRASPDRNALLGKMEVLTITDISRQQASGSNIWFEPVTSLPSAPKPPLFWKRWATSMLAVYPPLVLLVTMLKPITAHLPEAIGLFLVALILTGITTAFIVPWLTRKLHGWLVAR